MEKFRVDQIAADLPLTWALTERFRWSRAVNDVLKKDAEGKLLASAHDAVDWETYYERLKETPFHHWAAEGGGILTIGGPYHIATDCFFSGIGDTSTVEEDWLKEHPEFNQVLHEIHVTVAEQMIDHILQHAPEGTQEEKGPRDQGANSDR